MDGSANKMTIDAALSILRAVPAQTRSEAGDHQGRMSRDLRALAEQQEEAIKVLESSLSLKMDIEASGANEVQIGGDHYKSHGRADLQHWDVVNIFNLDYFQGNISKYLFRWKDKNGVQDLEKALHYLQKYLEIARTEKIDVLKKDIKDYAAVLEDWTNDMSMKWRASGSTFVYTEKMSTEQLARDLEPISSSDLLRVVQYREKQAEQALMDAHARSLSGDEGFVCTSFKGTVLGLTCAVCGKFLSDHLTTVIDDLNPAVAACAGCGWNAGTHAIDCPRVRDAESVHVRQRAQDQRSGPGPVGTVASPARGTPPEGP